MRAETGTPLTLAIVAVTIVQLVFLNWVDAIFGSLLFVTAMLVAVADLDRFEIPDVANATIFALGLAWNLKSFEFQASPFIETVLRSLLCCGFFLAARAVYRSLRNTDGLGLGDAKLAGAGAAWLSWPHTILALLLAAGAAIILVFARGLFKKQPISAQTPIPFGAFLAPAIWITWLVQICGL